MNQLFFCVSFHWFCQIATLNGKPISKPCRKCSFLCTMHSIMRWLCDTLSKQYQQQQHRQRFKAFMVQCREMALKRFNSVYTLIIFQNYFSLWHCHCMQLLFLLCFCNGYNFRQIWKERAADDRVGWGEGGGRDRDRVREEPLHVIEVQAPYVIR